MPKKNENQSNAEKFNSFKSDWVELRALLLQGNFNIVRTPVQLEFLRKHVDDPIDTLMELIEHKDSEFIQALQGVAKNSDDDKIKKVAKHLLEEIKAQPNPEEDAPDNESTLRPR
ncbi:hypothetical protein [Legionella tucsonensis]|uniref:Uncharacterized protein n=1 Tax=Legionella tucsonensis TaxID=40335 RepID=A0A0W0ZQR9_9GAMM|nr:hypothetical protein [Legionella tucsonensis]KTD71533.1 hypothetical protein Ltuc_2515 [Legionella tucsonensis]